MCSENTSARARAFLSALHLLGAQTSRIEHDSERIAAEFAIGKDIDGDEIKMHGGTLRSRGQMSQ